jgi:hypothetical protein
MEQRLHYNWRKEMGLFARLLNHKWSIIIILLIILCESVILMKESLLIALDKIRIYFLISTGILSASGFSVSATNKIKSKYRIITFACSMLGLSAFVSGIFWGQQIIAKIENAMELYFLHIPLVLILILVILLFGVNIKDKLVSIDFRVRR